MVEKKKGGLSDELVSRGETRHFIKHEFGPFQPQTLALLLSPAIPSPVFFFRTPVPIYQHFCCSGAAHGVLGTDAWLAARGSGDPIRHCEFFGEN